MASDRRPSSPIGALTGLLLSLILLLAPGAPAQEGAAASGSPERHVYSVARTRTGELELSLDLYRPRAAPARGAVILMHGGGFIDGHRGIEENRVYGEALARRGYVAAAISYRLHGDAPLVEGWAAEYSTAVRRLDDPRLRGALRRFGPEFTDAVAAAAVDLITAVDWLRSRADELGFEPHDIALFGASAGAITSLTTSYAMEFYGQPDVEVACVIDLRGLLLRPREAGNPFEDDEPPLLVLHGERDERVPIGEAEEVFRLATRGGTPVEFYTAPAYGHELGGDDLLSLKVDTERTVLDRIDEFLRAAFADEPFPDRRVRRRLLPAERPADRSGSRAGPRSASAGGDSAPQAELRTATAALIRSVREADDFVPSLYGLSPRRVLEHELSDPGRRDWSYWPRSRAGMPLRHMTAMQRALSHRILSTLLSSKGYLQVNHVMLLEEVLAGLETVGFARGAEEYTLAVFGDPRSGEPWGLRFEGHHLSLNVTLSPRGITVTPSFIGASPAPLATGIRAGFHPLAHEQRYAFDLLESLDPGQRAVAVVAGEPPSDVLTSQFQVDPSLWDRWADRLSRKGIQGIPVGTFDGRQKKLLGRLLNEIASVYRDEIALDRLDGVDLGALSFVWMGATAADRPHYFRIEGDRFVYEFDATGEDGSHVHTVWRDREGDFGGDLLAGHYRSHEH